MKNVRIETNENITDMKQMKQNSATDKLEINKNLRDII
jgi:hypothetical protein